MNKTRGTTKTDLSRKQVSKPQAGVLPPTPTIQVTNAFCVFLQLLTPELAGLLGAPFLLKTVTIPGITIPGNGLELQWDSPVSAQLPSGCVHFSHLTSPQFLSPVPPAKGSLHLVHGFLPHSGSEGCPSSCSPPPTPQVLPEGTHHTPPHKPHQQVSPSYQPG